MKNRENATSFWLENVDEKARAGRLVTPRGCVDTPLFMPVATQGSVKALDPEDLERVGAGLVLGNAYHLYLRPGVEIISNLGGLHRFMGWNGPILTDSGGFQGFSLKHLREIDENGITFRSHIDGSTHVITPESIIDVQEKLCSDIMMPLDVCLPYDADEESVSAGISRTNRWMERCIGSRTNTNQVLFGIVQGGLFKDLRRQSVAFMNNLDMPGYSIGGLSVGESKSEMYEITSLTAGLLPEKKPRYLMGVGAPEDIVECVARGIDMFDCVLPTRVARNGALYTRNGRINITAAKFKNFDGPVDSGCHCYCCERFSAAYLNHLFKAREYLAYRLASIHNLSFIFQLMVEIRSSIVEGEFENYRNCFWSKYRVSDQSVRTQQRKKWESSDRT